MFAVFNYAIQVALKDIEDEAEVMAQREAIFNALNNAGYGTHRLETIEEGELS